MSGTSPSVGFSSGAGRMLEGLWEHDCCHLSQWQVIVQGCELHLVQEDDQGDALLAFPDLSSEMSLVNVWGKPHGGVIGGACFSQA